LTYEDAQNLIDGSNVGGTVVDSDHQWSAIQSDVKLLQSLAKKLRTQRFRNGALSLESLSLSFKLDDNGLPVDCGQYERCDANYMIEEVMLPVIFIGNYLMALLQFMLLTNTAVGQHIAVHLPEQALLRRHDTPIERRLVSSRG
jgi:protein SSD1